MFGTVPAYMWAVATNVQDFIYSFVNYVIVIQMLISVLIWPFFACERLRISAQLWPPIEFRRVFVKDFLPVNAFPNDFNEQNQWK